MSIMSSQSKAALVLLMLGEEVAGEVFKRLNTDDIRLLSRGMSEMPNIEDEQRDDILEEFYDMCVKGDPLLLTNGVAFLNTLAEKFLDADANKALQEALVQDKQARLELEMVDSKFWRILFGRSIHKPSHSLWPIPTQARVQRYWLNYRWRLRLRFACEWQAWIRSLRRHSRLWKVPC